MQITAPKAKFAQFRCCFAAIPPLFHHSTPNVRSNKAASWLVHLLGGSLYVHISLSLSYSLPFLFLLLIV